MNLFEPICNEASMVDDDTVEMVTSTLSKLKIDVSDRRKKFIEANGVMTLPSTQYPTSGKGSTSSLQTPSSVRKQMITNSHEVVDCDEVPDQVVSQHTHVPELSQHLLDPNVKKRRRGRPKGSRNKPYSETGYKSTKKKQGKDVQPTSDVQPGDADTNMEMDLPLSAMRAMIPKVTAVPAKGRRKYKKHSRNTTVKLATCFEEEEEVLM
ncbi:uncharacterized protein LOC110704185 [Chenopodium quinoa]|uniref:uncharacterized protein LOC110704185 n=1 Tax=Chenopodium quinoa TaxID=63459 RepID=UPI000B7893ED|nr:uncharacterized protein LOC110704185 [Chenopodium quinoa]XP_021737666.1 uncharacterized protein LOC110704185 [Chenopodium quinoa]